MSWRRLWIRVRRSLLRRAQDDRDLDDEIRFRLAQETELRVERGASPEDARREARQAFGGVALARETTRAVWVPAALEQLLQDLRFGSRILTKSPALSATAVMLVALVVGGNTTVFSIAHSVLKKPAPGVRGGGLVRLNWVGETGLIEPATSYPNYQDLGAQSVTLGPILAVQPRGRFTLADRNGVYALNGALVSRNYFDTLGVHFAKGRSFTEEESLVGASGATAVISHRAWQDSFERAEDIIGRAVFLNGRPATIVGVVASPFRGTALGETADVWLPLVSVSRASGQARDLLDRSDYRVAVIGRLAPGASLPEADAELVAIWERLRAAYPDLKPLRVRLVPYTLTAGNGTLLDLYGDRFLAVLSIVTLLTLTIVCANVANLLIGRAVVRQREMALRQALGAPRVRIIRMLLAEGLVISSIAGGAALLSAWWVARALSGVIAPDGTILDFTPDWAVAGYAVVVAAAATLMFTIAPAVFTWRLSLLSWLKAGEHGIVQRRSKLSGGLVIVQLAFSVLLLTSAGVAYRSLLRMATIDVGFDPRNLLFVTVNTAGSATSADTNAALLERLRESLRRVPGVDDVSYARRPVFRDGGWFDSTIRSAPSSPDAWAAEYNHVGPDYLRVLRISPVLGRDFATLNGGSSRTVGSAVISQEVAEALWPGQSPLGRTLWVGDDTPQEVQVLGVMPKAIVTGGPRGAHRRVVLLSAQQEPAPPGETTLYVRYGGSLDAIAPAIRRRLREADPATPIVSMRTAEAQADTLAGPLRILTRLLALFACGSLLIAAIGQYAVLSFDIRRRVREIGLRLALGASSRQVLTSVVREGFRLTVMGLAIGFALSLVAFRGLGGVLFGVPPTDPLTYLGVFALLSAASLLACALPARRAARIDPMTTLRTE